MYSPPAFAETDPELLHAIMRENGFAMLVSAMPDGPLITHLPVLVNDKGTAIEGHMAKANPHWRALREEPRATVVFSGPHAYVSPSWYETAPAVPTWNFFAVHAHCRATVIEDRAVLEATLARLVAEYEANQDAPWRFESQPDEFRAAKLKGIVGFRLEIDWLEGKLKLSQDRPAADAGRVAETLARGDSDAERETAAAMRRLGGREI